MLVTKDNFEAVLPLFKVACDECDFISFDLEMSGIMNTRENRIQKSDSPSVRYQKVVLAASRYAVIQVGICLWSLNANSDDKPSWTVKEFTFFLFPSRGMDISMSPDSIDFLRKNNMDFGTWVTKGIPYTNRKQTEILTKKYCGAEAPVNGATVADDIVLTRPTDIEFLNRQKESIAKFMSADEEESITLDSCNNFLRKCIYQWLEKEYPDLTLDSVPDSER